MSLKSRSEKTDQKDVKRIMSVIRSHMLAGSELRKKMITAVMRRLGIWLWHAGVLAGEDCAVAAA